MPHEATARPHRLLRLARLALGMAAMVCVASPPAAAQELGAQQDLFVHPLENSFPTSIETAPDSAVAADTRRGQFLVVWSAAPNGKLIKARLTDSEGREYGTNDDARVWTPNATSLTRGVTPRVAYDPDRDQYLVVYTALLSDTTYEIRGRWVDSNGAVRGAYFRISAGDAGLGEVAPTPQVIYSSAHKQFMVVWGGKEQTGQSGGDVWAQAVPADGDFVPQPCQVSFDGVGTTGTTGATNPTVAYNNATHEYLVAYRTAHKNLEGHVSVRRLLPNAGCQSHPPPRFVDDASQLRQLGPPAVASDGTGYLVAYRAHSGVVSDILSVPLGGDGAPRGATTILSGPSDPTAGPGFAGPVGVTFAHAANRYLVAWSGTAAGAPQGTRQVFGQMVTPEGAQDGTDDLMISDMAHPTLLVRGADEYSRLAGALAYDPTNNAVLVSWSGDRRRTALPRADVFGRLVRMPRVAPPPVQTHTPAPVRCPPSCPPAPPPPPPKWPPVMSPLPDVVMSLGFSRSGRLMLVNGLKVRSTPIGARIQIICKGKKKCPFRSRTKVKKHGGDLALHPQRKLGRARVKVAVRISLKGHIGRVFTFSMRRGDRRGALRRGKRIRCMMPGSTKPFDCSKLTRD